VTKLGVVTEQPLGSGTTFDVFKCVNICHRHCQLDERVQFVVIFENNAVHNKVYFINYILFKVKEVD
jgi:hypothetical protein